MKTCVMCLAVLLCIVCSGCATVPEKNDVVVLQAKVSTLEKQVRSIEQEQAEIKKALHNQGKQQENTGRILNKYQAQKTAAVERQKFNPPSNKDIQTALKNAGYYDGVVDGKIGPKTRSAVMQFQGENDLKVDGIVGRGTWELLEEYL